MLPKNSVSQFLALSAHEREQSFTIYRSMKTKCIKESLSPDWDGETHWLEVKDVKHEVLLLSVWDKKGMFTANVLMGESVIDVADLTLNETFSVNSQLGGYFPKIFKQH